MVQYHTLLTKRNASFGKKPSLHWLQWDLSCFVMSPKWHVLKQVRIRLRETREEYRNGVFCKLLSEPFDKMYMTRGQGQWHRVTGKNGFRKVAFLLKKSVFLKINTDWGHTEWILHHYPSSTPFWLHCQLHWLFCVNRAICVLTVS